MGARSPPQTGKPCAPACRPHQTGAPTGPECSRMPSRQAWPQPGTSHLGPRPHGPRERHHPTRIHHLPCPQLASPPCSQPVQVPAPSLRPRCTRSDQKPLTWVVSGRASQHGCRHGATPRRARAGPEGLQPTCSCTGLGGHAGPPSPGTTLPRVMPPKRCPCQGALPAGLTPQGRGREEGDWRATHWPAKPSAGRAPRPLQRARRWACPRSSREPNSAAPTGRQSRLPPPRGSWAREEFNVVLGAREGHVGVFLLPACDL